MRRVIAPALLTSMSSLAFSGTTTLTAAAGGTTDFVRNSADLTLGDVTGRATTGNVNTMQFDGGSTASAVNGVISDGAGGGKVGLALNGGQLILNGASTYSGNTTVAGGTTMTVNGLLGSATNVTDNGLLSFAGTSSTTAKTQVLASLAIGSGQTVSITHSAFPFTPTTLKPGTTTYADGSSKIDIANNAFITAGTAAGALTQIQSGQIFSSEPADTSMAIGYINLGGADTGKFEVRYTLKGYANLDGTVNVGDLGALATNYNITGGMSWGNGDFIQDGTVNVADLGALATNYNNHLATGPSFGSGALSATPLAVVAAGGSASVPEPASVGLVLLGGVSLLSRRRRPRTLILAHRCHPPLRRSFLTGGRRTLLSSSSSRARASARSCDFAALRAMPTGLRSRKRLGNSRAFEGLGVSAKMPGWRRYRSFIRAPARSPIFLCRSYSKFIARGNGSPSSCRLARSPWDRKACRCRRTSRSKPGCCTSAGRTITRSALGCYGTRASTARISWRRPDCRSGRRRTT